MTPHRDPLAAALARTEAAEARATAGAATPACRWGVVRREHAWPFATGLIASATASVAYWPGHDALDRVAFVALAVPLYGALWALAFLRRVPVGGGGR